MIKNLVLAESKAKLSILADTLGREYTTLCVRPVLDFRNIKHPPDKFSIYEAFSFLPSEKQNLVKALGNAERVYLAFDPNPAGEAASIFLKQFFHPYEANVTRVYLPFLGEGEILDAFSRGKKPDSKWADRYLVEQYVNFVLANTVLAPYQNFKVPLTWLDLFTLFQLDKLERQCEQKSNNIVGEFAIGRKTISVRLESIKGEAVVIPDQNHFKAVLYELENREFSLEVERETVAEPAPGLFDIGALAEDAHNYLKMSAATLVENLCHFYTGSADWPPLIVFADLLPADSYKPNVQRIRELVMENYGASYVRTKAGGETTASSIFPASMIPPKNLDNLLSANLMELYNLIWTRTLASEMRDAVVQKTRVKIIDQGRIFCFAGEGSQFRHKGFRTVYDHDPQSSQSALPAELAGKPHLQRVRMEEANHRSFWLPALIDDTESAGFTNLSNVIKSLAHLEKNGLVEFVGNKYVLGKKAGRLVSGINPELFKNSTVGYLKDLFGYIWAGNLTAAQGFYEIRKLKESVSDKWDKEKSIYSRTNFGPCPECGKMLVERSSKFGRFLACSGYPKCKYTKPMSIGVNCPEIGCPGEVIERQTKSKKLFYGCSEYPGCNFSSWQEPVGMICPQCNHSHMVKKGLEINCPKCSFKMLRNATAEYSA